MNRYHITKGEAKMTFISVLNGGGKPKYDDRFIAEFYNEIKNLRNVVVTIEENETLVNEAKNENRRNINGSVMCLRYQIIENEILHSAIAFLQNTNITTMF